MNGEKRQAIHWPATTAELAAARYEDTAKRRPCNGPTCSATIYWWKSPAGKPVPLSRKANEPGELYEPHWASCPDAKVFKR